MSEIAPAYTLGAIPETKSLSQKLMVRPVGFEPTAF